MGDERVHDLITPPIEYERKETKKTPAEEKISDKDFFKLIAFPADKLVEFIDKSSKK